MKTVIIPPKAIFVSNKLLRQHYTERQLGAIYELLLGERFAQKTIKMLKAKDLITVEIEDVPSGIGWAYTEYIFTVNTIGETE